jgi:hypothetical protein
MLSNTYKVTIRTYVTQLTCNYSLKKNSQIISVSDPGPALYLNADPDPESQTNADPCGSGVW